jgi:hypothetical protein
MKDTQEGFVMDAATAEIFFSVCHELKLETLEERMAVMRLLVKEKRAGYLRDVKAYVKDKKVLQIKGKL